MPRVCAGRPTGHSLHLGRRDGDLGEILAADAAPLTYFRSEIAARSFWLEVTCAWPEHHCFGRPQLLGVIVRTRGRVPSATRRPFIRPMCAQLHISDMLGGRGRVAGERERDMRGARSDTAQHAAVSMCDVCAVVSWDTVRRGPALRADSTVLCLSACPPK